MIDRARLVLMTPQVGDAAAWPADLTGPLEQALAAGRVDAVIIRLPKLDERTLIKLLKPVIALVQEHGAAALLEDAPLIVARSGADGAHASQPEGLKEALDTLKPHDRIVGVGGLRARHDSMEAAEVGCDYVLFGEPRDDGTTPPFSAVLDRVSWWAEVFQVPCVGYVADLADVREMAATGCEFVAVGEAAFQHPDGPGEAVKAALAAIGEAAAQKS